MRRVVRDYIAAGLDRQKPQLERYVAEHLRCPQACPLVFTEPAVTIREVRRVKIAPRFRTDYPPVDVTVMMCVSIHRRDAEPRGRSWNADARAGRRAGRTR